METGTFPRRLYKPGLAAAVKTELDTEICYTTNKNTSGKNMLTTAFTLEVGEERRRLALRRRPFVRTTTFRFTF